MLSIIFVLSAGFISELLFFADLDWSGCRMTAHKPSSVLVTWHMLMTTMATARGSEMVTSLAGTLGVR